MSSSRATSIRRARSRSLGVAVGVLGALGGAVLTAGPAAAAAGDPFAALRQCESGSNYATNTGNGFYGAYQFDAQTWRGLGLPGLPSAASPATQDAAARTLQAQRGWQPWPACSARLGLGSAVVEAAPARRASRSRAAAAVPPTATRAAAPVPRAAPARADALPLFTVALVNQVRADVRAWQQAMVERGYPLAVDGQYGPQSAEATHNLEVRHGLQVEAVGIVGPQVRAALAQTQVVTR